MGKALLIILLGAGLVMARQAYHNGIINNKTSAVQVEYEEQVLAREIARSAFNVAMGRVRSHGEGVDLGVEAVMGENGKGMSGKDRGGTFSARAYALSGHSVQVVSTGRFGDAEVTMHDSYRVPVLIARERSRLDVRFIESRAGYCSAVFMQKYLPETAPEDQPEPQMIFTAGKGRDGSRNPISTIVEAGTQLNFFIGVDKRCSMQTKKTGCELREYLTEYEYDPDDFNHVHYALNIPVNDFTKATEAVWGMVEQAPGSRQRWRIGWEDQHKTKWDNPDSDDPARSMQALKRYGYDGNGWTERWVPRWLPEPGYRKLRNYGNRPDYSDQVIEVTLHPLGSMAAATLELEENTERLACGLPPQDTSRPPSSDDGGSGSSGDDDGDDDGDYTPSDESAECGCTERGRSVAVMHREPGDPDSEKIICVSIGSANKHLRRHDDYIVCQN